MVKTPKTRHSTSRREPLTIELGPDEVARLESAPVDAEPEDAAPVAQAETDAGEAAQDSPHDAEPRDEAAATDAAPAEEPAAEPQPAPAFGRNAAGASAPENGGRRGSDGFSRVAAGIVGAVVALLLAAGLQYAGVLGAPGSGTDAAARTDIAALKGQLAALEAARPDDSTARLTALSQSLDAVKADVAALKQAGPGAATADVQAMDERLKALEAAVAKLGSAPGQPGTVPADIADRLAAVEAAAGTAQTALAAAGGRIEALEKSLAALSAKVEGQASQPKVAVSIAGAALKSAIDRGVPFATELESFAALAPDAPGLDGLRALAEKGVPTRDALAGAVASAAEAMIAADQPLDPDAGFFARLLHSADTLVTVRPIGAVEGNTVPAIVARMEVDVKAGDFAAATREFDSLPDAAKAAAADFGTALKARQQAESLADAAIAAAMKA